MLSVFCSFFLLTIPRLFSTPLDDYIAAPDSAYRWEVRNSAKGQNYTVYDLDLVSQTWRNADEVDRPLWTHSLIVVVPDNVQSKYTLLNIWNGFNGDVSQSLLEPNEEIIQIAMATSSIVAGLKMIPNQYLKFSDEWDQRYIATGRKEDAIIAYSWDKYLKTQDPVWSVRLPMTKAVVKAMDALEEFYRTNLKVKQPFKGFVLSGKSKRGWTAWTTAAVDSRVKAVIPIVIDLLNLKVSFKKHYQAYGGWSPAVNDYLDVSIPARWDSQAFDDLMQLEEPFNYRERIIIPKYVINSTGDEFFLPDSSHLYIPYLQGETHLRNIPNANHSLQGSDYLQSVTAFYQDFIHQKSRPNISWILKGDGTLEAKTNSKPTAIKLWSATNPKARDFRFSSIGNAWSSQDLEIQANGVYQTSLVEPKQGWTAYFIEFTFDNGFGMSLKFTTDVFVTPDTLPHQLPSQF